MFFMITLSNLIFSVFLSSQIDFGSCWHGSSKFEADDSQSELSNSPNKTHKRPNTIDRSDLEELLNLKHQYVLKNHIDDYETHFGLPFTPNWTKIDKYSSPARQCVEIRRQRWHYILNNFNQSLAIVRLNDELRKAGINRTIFCKDIAELYFVLSNNAYIFDKEPNSDKRHKYFEFVRNPLHERSVNAFMNSVANSQLVWSKHDEIVQLPKSLYVDLMRKDAHAAVIKLRHRDQLRRLKDAFRERIRDARTRFRKYDIVALDSEISFDSE